MSEAVSALPLVTSLVTGDLLTMVKVSDTTTSPAGAGGSNKRITAGNLAKYMVALGLNNRGAVAASTAYNPGDVVAYNGQHVLITAAVTSTSWSAWNSPPTLTGGTYTPIDGMDIWHASDWGVKGDAGSTDNGPILNRAMAAMWGAGLGGFIVLPFGDIGSWIQVSSTVIIPPKCILVGQGIEGSMIKLAGSSNVDTVQFMEYNSSSQATILSAATGATIAATSLENAFYAGLMHASVNGHSSGQAATGYNSAVNMTTNPTSSTATSDPDFDPSNILFDVEITGATGDGFTHVGRGQLRVSNCVFRYNNGWGAVTSFDSIYTGNNFGENGLGGVYNAFASCNGSANKAFNNGGNAPWVSGTAYTALTVVMDVGLMYVCISAVTSATHPASDATHWAHISAATAPQYWGCGFVFDGVGENAWESCDGQQNSASDYYLHSCTGVRVDGLSKQPNWNQVTSAQNTSNPNNYASVALDGSSGCLVDVVASTIHAGLVAPLKNINSSTRNDVRMTGDSTVTAVLSADSTALAGTGNSVKWNGVYWSGMTFSVDGTQTSGGAIVLDQRSEGQGFLGIYSAALAAFASLVPDIATTGKAPSMGLATAHGFGICGATSGGTNVVFGVLNFAQTGGYGLGNATFTCLDNNQVYTNHNTLDDGSGNAITAGLASHNGGTDTSTTAAYTNPTFTTATAKQLSTTQDVMLYIAVKTAISVTLAIGSANTTADSIVPATVLSIGSFVSVRIPKGWWVKLTCATMGDLQLSQVTC